MSESESTGAASEENTAQSEAPRMRILMPDNCPVVYGDRVFLTQPGDRGDVSFSFYQFIPDFSGGSPPEALQCQVVVQTPPDRAAQLALWALSMVLERVGAENLRPQVEEIQMITELLVKKLEELNVQKNG